MEYFKLLITRPDNTTFMHHNIPHDRLGNVVAHYILSQKFVVSKIELED